MVFKVDFADDGGAVEWRRTADGAAATPIDDYAPAVYVAGEEPHLADLRATLEADPKVLATDYEAWYTSLHADERERVLRADVERIGEIRALAREVRGVHERGTYPPGTFRLFDVDLSPQFRYCVETGTCPTPDRPLSTLSVRIGEKALADGDLTALRVGGERVAGPEEGVVHALRERLDRADPDVLVLSDAGLVPLLDERAADRGLDDFALGRRPGYRTLAGANTFENHGRVAHSPARYDVPGRVIVDESNSFLWGKTNLRGLLDLVEHSWQPLQETAWASIGSVLTAIEVREALARDVLVPWNKWEPEAWKGLDTLHAADRGGFVFAPDVGLHEDVVEVDFASLYPRIICERNVSPDTVCCDCHADRADVPELGYSVCDEPGFLGAVLSPLLDRRAGLKERASEAAAAGDADRAAALSERSDAIKWVLVSCFGYQGYRNSKFGRIECHEAINAVARDVLLQAKEVFEANGWRVVHGIVDSLWVQRRDDADPAPLPDLTDRVTDRVGISLDFEREYDWVCFVPQRGSGAGALTKYFGKVAGADDGAAGTDPFKVRGIELRQRSTPPFVADAQRALLAALDRHREPVPVCEVLRQWLGRLRRGDVAATDLVVRQRVSKRPAAYTHRTRAVAAMRRADELGLDVRPGQDVRYVVVDDDARLRNRVRLHFEDPPSYDADFYADRLLRAAESVLSPLGWDRASIERHLRGTTHPPLDLFAGREGAQ